MELKLISGDGHIDLPWLPADLFVSNVPARLKDRMPHVEDTEEGKQWFANGMPLGLVAGINLDAMWHHYVPGQSHRLDRMEEVAFFSDGQIGQFHPTTPELRIKDQNLDGVSGEVIYGIQGLSGGLSSEAGSESEGVLPGLGDPKVAAQVWEIYNQWAADFCASSPQRFAGLACLSGHDPHLAARQLRRAAELGLRGAELNVARTGEPIYHQSWDVLWAAAAECRMPISFHTLGINPRLPRESDRAQYHWVSNGLIYTLFHLSGAEYMASMVFSGACDRFPDLNFVLGECGAGWVPYVLQRMDELYEKHLFHLGLSLKPSELWKRQGHTTFQNEYLSEETARLAGEDNLIWGSDYPHADGVWPDSRQVIQQTLGHLDSKLLKKIVHDNAAQLYGFK